MTHLDLFSGIGGFAYAIDQIWDNVEHIFCDNEPFAQQVLKKHWPGSYIYDDIRRINESVNIDILTGGFPCQPFSAAGVRRGTSDERYLWPEMLRVIQLTQPQWVIAENVGGLLTWEEGLVLQQVCTDLEAAGYEVQPFIIPAVAVNAPHRRDRVWFVARNTKHDGRTASKERQSGEERSHRDTARQNKDEQPARPDLAWNTPENTISKRSRGRNEDSGQVLGRKTAEIQDERPDWSRNWFEVATELCSLDDGLPAKLDGFELSKPQHRAQQLKAYGNAIVPEVAYEILRGIKQYDTIG